MEIVCVRVCICVCVCTCDLIVREQNRPELRNKGNLKFWNQRAATWTRASDSMGLSAQEQLAEESVVRYGPSFRKHS